MLEDKLLVWKFRHGSRYALCRIYEKYKNDMLALAVALSNDKSAAEDVVHDVFVSFAGHAKALELRKNLKGYLLTSVANRVRNLSRLKYRETVQLDGTDIASRDTDQPECLTISAEQSQRIAGALAGLPYDQREVIILRLQSGLKFSEIADSLGVSVNTVQSRYRYGLDKLRSTLNGEVTA